jgi:peptidoglycan/xylan/chitin deacetylase (PgdA/CDA1 family)
MLLRIFFAKQESFPHLTRKSQKIREIRDYSFIVMEIKMKILILCGMLVLVTMSIVSIKLLTPKKDDFQKQKKSHQVTRLPQPKQPENVWDNVIVRIDDGPDKYTVEIVKTLKELGVKHAIFGLIGRNVKNYPDALPEIINAGYTIANHTWTHPRMHSRRARAYYLKNPDRWKNQIVRTTNAIDGVLKSKGISYKCKVFCCPEISNYLPPLLKKIVREQGLDPDRGWDIDSRDSIRGQKRLRAKEIVYKINKIQSKNGVVKVLFHSGKGGWAEELREIDKILSSSKEGIAVGNKLNQPFAISNSGVIKCACQDSN